MHTHFVWPNVDDDLDDQDRANVDEDGWDRTPGQDPTFVGLP